MQATSEIFDWLKPSPLWSGDAEELLHGDLFRPRLLQFESDQFIDDFLKIVKQSKLGSQELLADGVVKPPPGNVPATLYQPAHGVFYLVCASLCCRQAGFPDRVINRGQGDKVSFVVRKLMPDNSELGWCGEAKQKSWQSVPTPAASVAPTEELKPLMTADASDGRTLLFGYVPVASRETYAAGKDQLITDPPTVNKDLRVQEFGSRFTGNFVAPPGSALPLQGKSPLEANLGANASSLELIVSLNLFLDLSEFFALYIPAVAGALGFSPDPKAPPFTGTTAAQDKLLKTLADQVLVQIDHEDLDGGYKVIVKLKEKPIIEEVTDGSKCC